MFTQESSIKFGSWDEQGLREGTRLRVVKTVDPDSWHLSLSEVFIANKEFELSNPVTKVLIEPQFPYIYLPEADFISY